MLIMLNSAVNPFVYALLNQRFKQKLKGLVSCNFHPRNKVNNAKDTVVSVGK